MDIHKNSQLLKACPMSGLGNDESAGEYILKTIVKSLDWFKIISVFTQLLLIGKQLKISSIA